MVITHLSQASFFGVPPHTGSLFSLFRPRRAAQKIGLVAWDFFFSSSNLRATGSSIQSSPPFSLEISLSTAFFVKILNCFCEFAVSRIAQFLTNRLPEIQQVCQN